MDCPVTILTGCSGNREIIHNPFELPSDFIKPKFEYYRHVQDFFKKSPFSEFNPAPEKNASAYCLSSGEGTLLLYVPKEHCQRSRYNSRKGGTVQWFNTRTGEYTEEKEADARFNVSPWCGEADSILIWMLE